MALRSVWKGNITFSLVTIGIKVYTAVESAQRIAFNQLHKGTCLGSVGRKDFCKKCEVTIATKDEISRGYKHGDEEWVVVTDEEIESITPASNKTISILGFVDRSEIPDTFFESPYLAAPDGPACSKVYALFCAVLQQTGKVAIGKVILREREDPVAISATAGGLVIQTLRYAREVRTFAALPAPPKSETISDDELQLATTLVQSLMTSFDQIDLTDHYYDSLRKMLDQKIAGEEVQKVETAAQPEKVVDIMAALRASLAIATAANSEPVTAHPNDTVVPASAPDANPAQTQLTLVSTMPQRKKSKRAA